MELRDDALEDVVSAALAYQDEKQRDDPAHKARLSMRRRDVVAAMRYYGEIDEKVRQTGSAELHRMRSARE